MSEPAPAWQQSMASLSPDELLASMIQDADAQEAQLATEFPGLVPHRGRQPATPATGPVLGNLPLGSASSIFADDDEYSSWSSNAVHDWRTNTVAEMPTLSQPDPMVVSPEGLSNAPQDRRHTHPFLMFDPSNVTRIATPLNEEEETPNLSYHSLQPDRPLYHKSRSESEFSAHSAASTHETGPESLHAMYQGSHHENEDLRLSVSPRQSPDYHPHDHTFSPAELFLLGISGRESVFASGASTPSIATTGTGTSTPVRVPSSASPVPGHHGGHQPSKFGHMVINAQGKRVHQCYHCDKQFTTSGHLARHCRIHTGERKFTCPVESCGAPFSRRDNCTTHLKKHFVTKNMTSNDLDAATANLLVHYQNLLKEQHMDSQDAHLSRDEPVRPGLERNTSSGTSGKADSVSLSPALQPQHESIGSDRLVPRRASLHSPLIRSARSNSSRSTDDLLLGLQRHNQHAHTHSAHHHAHVAASSPASSASPGDPHLPHHHQQAHPKAAHVQAGGVRKPPVAERGSGVRSRSLSRANSRTGWSAVSTPAKEEELSSILMQPPEAEAVLIPTVEAVEDSVSDKGLQVPADTSDFDAFFAYSSMAGESPSAGLMETSGASFADFVLMEDQPVSRA